MLFYYLFLKINAVSFQKLTGKSFDITELGYNSIADLVEALPDIFKRVSNPDDKQSWLIYPSGSHIQESFKGKFLLII